MEFLDLIETIRAEEADTATLFKGEGLGARSRNQAQTPKYKQALLEAAQLVQRVRSGSRRAAIDFQEAMTTSDFPVLFGDILDRQILANYQEAPYSWSTFAKRAKVRDFRAVRRMKLEGGEGVLSEVIENGPYQETKLQDGSYGYKVAKYGRRLPISWESLINDDLDAFNDIPVRFGRAARRSEEKFATQLIAGASGPNGSLISGGNGNQLTGNPALSIAALQAAMTQLSQMRDSDNEPIMVEAIVLVVPPALEVIANNIANATQLELNSDGGTNTQRLVGPNWMRNRLKIAVNFYLPVVSATANGNTSWYLVADPNNGRPAVEMGFLMGHEQPEMFIRSANAQRIGGGTVTGSFDNDTVDYKIRHVFGGGTQDPKMIIGSNGSGS